MPLELDWGVDGISIHALREEGDALHRKHIPK